MAERKSKVLSREEVLALLSGHAEAGSVSAAIALERALRIADSQHESEVDVAIDRLLGEA
jgi:hypothetical protein